MRKFKSKKKSNYTIIYLGVFLISMALTINFLYQHNLVKDDTLIDILMKDNFNLEKDKIEDVDFLLK